MVEQGSDFAEMTLRLSTCQGQRRPLKQGFLNFRLHLGVAMKNVPPPDLPI